MEINVPIEELRKNKLFVATPMYGGKCYGLYMKSCLDLQNLCIYYGIDISFSFIFNESLIQRGRAYCADEFLRSNSTHLLFVDSDIAFDPKDALALMALDKDVIAAPYPKKSINWKSIKEAVKKNPDIEPNDLNDLVGEYVFNVVHGTEKFKVDEPVEVMEAGTGFMLIKREVFEKIRENFPELSYLPDHVGQAHFDGTRRIHMFFDSVIDSKDSIIGDGSDRYLSEDYFFCRLWRKLGGKVWLCPWMKTLHIGSYHFTGNLPKISQYTGKL